MARNFFWIFTENNPVMWDSKTFCIPEVKGLSTVARKPEETCKQGHLLREPETPG